MRTARTGKAAATLLFLAVVLTGCSPSAPGVITAEEYYELVSEIDTYREANAEQMDRLGTSTCEALRAGNDDDAWLRTVEAITDGGLNAQDAGRLIAYATARHCPDMTDRLPES